MHIVTLHEPLSNGPQGEMSRGEYLCEDRNGAEIILRSPGATMLPYPIENRLPMLPAKILIFAICGFGDAILLTPCLRELKRRFPAASVTLACFPEYRQPYFGLPYVDGYADYPMPMEDLDNYDCILFLERSVEFNPLGRTQHMTDRFAEHLGLPELADKKPDYRVTGSEEEWIRASFPRKTGTRRIGFQIQAGVRSRTYPQAPSIKLIKALIAADWEVAIMGRPGEFAMGGTHPRVMDLSRRGLTWRQSAAFLQSCDVFFGPDSSLLHAAGSLDIPAVGVFGAYPWKLRTAYYPSVHALQATGGCNIQPCFHVDHTGFPPYPVNGPCSQTGYCTALESITPERVMAKIEQVARRQGQPAGSVIDLPPPALPAE